MADPIDDPLLIRIRALESRIAALDAERRECSRVLESLRRDAELESGDALPPTRTTSIPTTAAEKVELFQRLFRGRSDVYPRRWENVRTGKSGYAPACANEWVKGLCEKPRVKCGACTHQAFLPFDDRAVLDHLQGRHVAGVYPMMKDEHCWFAALDFDGDGWRDDVSAFSETCAAHGLRPAVERSRSGNGAHAWFFFEGPVAARVARAMVSTLLGETSALRRNLGLASYDRVFPNQDVMPKGGFGNLIALPLQHACRPRGNTVFLDANFEPLAHDEQWAFLANVQRVAPDLVQRIAARGAAQRQVFDTAAGDEVDAQRPGFDREAHVVDALREAVRAWRGDGNRTLRVLIDRRLEIETNGMPGLLTGAIQRLAAFANPEFYKRQNLRLSTARTPRVISCVESTVDRVSLPRGCWDALQAMAASVQLEIQPEDRRFDGGDLSVTFRGELQPRQAKACEAVLRHDAGVLVAPPGAGKTVMACWLIAARRRATLVLVHRAPLLDQWVSRLASFLGVESSSIGVIGAGRRARTGAIDVAMIQTLVRGDVVDPMVGEYAHVVVDECHHVPAVSFERVMNSVRGRYVLGLTATPKRRDGLHPILMMQVGPVCAVVGAQLESRAELVRELVVRETSFRTISPDGVRMQDLQRELAHDESRNRQIVDDVLEALEEGRSPIVLVERRDHVDLLTEEIRRGARHVVVLRGGTARARKAANDELAAIAPDAERVLVATGRFIGEGFDDPRLDTLLLVAPVAWKGTLIQYAGRLQRELPRKRSLRVVDYVDRDVPVLARMFQRRKRAWKSLGYLESNDAAVH